MPTVNEEQLRRELEHALRAAIRHHPSDHEARARFLVGYLTGRYGVRATIGNLFLRQGVTLCG